MNESILLYDIYDDNKNVLNSQVILDSSVGFEIPKDYYFNQSSTDFKERILHLLNDKNFIRIYYEKCDDKDYEKKLDEIKGKYKITEDFTNYRGQKIIEYENETGMNVICYDGTTAVVINTKCHKYSIEYYVLYFIAFSFDSDCSNTYENSYYQKNNYCILKNAKHIYEKYKINLIKYNPSESLSIISKENFCQYIINKEQFDYEIDNYYVSQDKVFKNIVNKIVKYNNNLKTDDDPSLMDLIEE